MTDVEVYWMPGCSSCLRMKEFIERAGVPYVSFNVDAEPARRDVLRAHGIHGVPAICVGDRCVNGVDLAAVANLIGIDYHYRPPLPAPVLVERFRALIAALHRLLPQLPPGGLSFKLRDRDRDMADLTNQVASVMRTFLSAFYEDRYDTAFYNKPDAVVTVADILARADETLALLEQWWEQDGFDDPLDRPVTAYWGVPTLHEALERETWHTAQHLRQLQYALELLGVAVVGPLTELELGGLPLPERIHD